MSAMLYCLELVRNWLLVYNCLSSWCCFFELVTAHRPFLICCMHYLALAITYLEVHPIYCADHHLHGQFRVWCCGLCCYLQCYGAMSQIPQRAHVQCSCCVPALTACMLTVCTTDATQCYLSHYHAASQMPQTALFQCSCCVSAHTAYISLHTCMAHFCDDTVHTDSSMTCYRPSAFALASAADTFP